MHYKITLLKDEGIMVKISQEKRSHIMRSIHSKNTKPEKIISSILNILEIEYISHHDKLVGKPDFYCDAYQAIILVNGCFWHGHKCHMYRAPNPTKKYWTNKLKKNIERDKHVIFNLNSLGYKILVIWECALLGKKRLDLIILQDCIEEWLLAGNKNCEVDYQGIRTMHL